MGCTVSNFCGPGEGVNPPATPPATVRIIVNHKTERGNNMESIVRFTNVPLSIVEEAIAHINDNGQVNP